MDRYERNVRRLIKTIDDFFEMKGLNAEELQKQIAWMKAYHESLDKERSDRAEQLQVKLRL